MKPRTLAFAFVIIHGCLLTWSAYRHSPVSDETAQMASGLFLWELGRWDLYPGTPPFVRGWATLPVYFSGPETDWSRFSKDMSTRPEWKVGSSFVKANRSEDVYFFFFLGRLALAPLVMLGGVVCWLWASELFGQRSGLVATFLWCISPNILAWGATICPDAVATSLGVTCSYALWKWLDRPSWLRAGVAGLLLGIALLTKFTWGILIPILLVGSVLTCWKRDVRRHAVLWQLVTILILGLYVVNLGYGFEGTCRPLGDFKFYSRTLAASDSLVEGGAGGNRFSDLPVVGRFPVVLPALYIEGIDIQQVDFERELESDQFSQWADEGSVWYYAVCFALKVPLGTLLLGLAALPGSAFYWSDHPSRKRRLFLLFATPLALLLLVSSQAGIDQPFRHTLPTFPFLFILISVFASRVYRSMVLVFCTLTFLSTMFVYPHTMSYFNELKGGPVGGPRFLLGSDLDWGQDLQFLEHWCEGNPDKRPLHVLHRTSYSRDLLQAAEIGPPPPGPNSSADVRPWQLGPRPGWFACSVDQVFRPNSHHSYFRFIHPVANAGYSINIYHITPAVANRVRRKLGLAPTRPISETHDEPIFSPRRATSVSAARRAGPIRVAVFTYERESIREFSFLTELNPLLECFPISPSQIRNGLLKQFDVVVFPGGSGRQHSSALGVDGGASVREFVSSGGLYVGICGGAFLATAGYDWSLSLVNCMTITGRITVGLEEKSLSERGQGQVSIELSSFGNSLFHDLPDDRKLSFSGGPVLLPANREDLPAYSVLASYRSEITRFPQQIGTMIDTPAIVAASFGKGRVVLFGPHPEENDLGRTLLLRTIDALAENR